MQEELRILVVGWCDKQACLCGMKLGKVTFARLVVEQSCLQKARPSCSSCLANHNHVKEIKIRIRVNSFSTCKVMHSLALGCRLCGREGGGGGGGEGGGGGGEGGGRLSSRQFTSCQAKPNQHLIIEKP